MRAATCGLLPVLCLLGGCAAGDSPGAGTLVTDSAGVVIVDSRSPVWGEGGGWTVDSVPRLDLGVADGPEEVAFSGIRTVRFRAGGGFVVAQQTELRYFDASGNYERTTGRQGSGPGEFQLIGGMEFCDGAVHVSDFLTGMLTTIRAGGEFESTSLAREDYATTPTLAGCADDALILHVPLGGPSTGVTVRPPFALVKMSAGTPADTLVELEGQENFEGLRVPFGRTTLFAVRDSFVYVADTGASEIRVFDPDGVLRRIVRLPARAMPVTPEAIERVHAQYLDGPAEIIEVEIRPRLEKLEPPATMPEMGALFAAPDGTIWIAPYYPFEQGEDREWRVVGADGRWLGTITMPSGLRVHAIGVDAVLGVWRDEYDVEHVRLYAIRR